MVISPGIFFIFFFLILVFWAVREVKGQKIAQNEKWQLHPLHVISNEQYHHDSISSWFLVHLCKMMISQGFFSSFSNFWFFELLEGWKGKKKTVQNDKVLYPSRFISQEPYIIWLSFMVRLSKMIISLDDFFIFSKFWFIGLLGG